MSAPSVYFDSLAKTYDETWTHSPAGRAQRNAVWRVVDPFVREGARILDYGCGTGEDALHFTQMGAQVDAFDPSPAMVSIARQKGGWASARAGLQARLLKNEAKASRGLKTTVQAYDLVFSNFGALNCVENITSLQLETFVRPGGILAICIMGRFCLWETAYYLLRGQFTKAKRRWNGRAETSTGMRVFYPSIENLRFPNMRLIQDAGIGITVPPSFVKGIPARIIRCLEAIDQRFSKPGRSIGDHRLLLFVKSR